jgi:hypothetical protein
MRRREIVTGLLLSLLSHPAAAQNPRDLLMAVAFTPSTRADALSGVGRAIAAADAALIRDPGDREARLQRAVAISYRGRLRSNRADLKAALLGFEEAVAADPRNAEAHMALAGWHLGAVIELGSMLAGIMLGASKAKGERALDRALALGGTRAFFPAVASLHRIQLYPQDVTGARRLAELALAGETPTNTDRVLQRQAAALLAVLRPGNGKAAAKAARRLLPFGQVR